MSKKHIIIRAGIIVMVATLLSKVLGLLRLQLINYLFPDTRLLDPFWAAFAIPDSLRRLFGEGVISAAFIPVISEIIVKEKDRDRLIGNVISVFSVFVILISIIMVFVAKYYVPIYVSGFSKGKLLLTISLTQYMMFFITFISISSSLVGVLNSYKHFTLPALMPFVFNVVWIVSMLTLKNHLGIYSLVAGVMIGSIVQIIILAIGIYKAGIGIKLMFVPRDKYIKKIYLLMLPVAGMTIINIINSFFSKRFASVFDGGVSAIQNSIFIGQLPISLFAIAISTVMLPLLSEYFAKRDTNGFALSTSRLIKSTIAMMFPSAMFLFLYSDIISMTIFFNIPYIIAGKSKGVNFKLITMTSQCLKFLAIGIPFLGLVNIMQKVFYARQNTKTPLICFMLQMSLNILFMWYLTQTSLQYTGIPLSLSLSFFIEFIVMLAIFSNKKIITVYNIFAYLLRVFIAGGLALLSSYAIYIIIRKNISISYIIDNIIYILAVFIVFVASGYIYYKVFKIKEANDITGFIKKYIKR